MSNLHTDLKALDAMTDQDIEQGVENDPDAAPLMTTLKPSSFRRGLQKAPTKIPTSIRLSPQVIEYFRESGKGWQSKVDAILMDYIKAEHEKAEKRMG